MVYQAISLDLRAASEYNATITPLGDRFVQKWNDFLFGCLTLKMVFTVKSIQARMMPRTSFCGSIDASNISVSFEDPHDRLWQKLKKARTFVTYEAVAEKGEKITIQCMDLMILQADANIMKACAAFNDMAQEIPSEKEKTVFLYGIKGNAMKKVIEWCEHHAEDQLTTNEETYGKSSSPTITSWDIEFFQMDTNEMLDLLMAAYYLEVKGLKEVGGIFLHQNAYGHMAPEVSNVLNMTSE
ncbi:hypothetical protein M514_01145 [Trichuris suis]|uniref:SKP1 component POZ domain-containing protein n=1 Tax=Trichuris suis TaxID=68888 RepID=A0A085NN67_9BILA|nr:hypothetical protein M513_01145 [Trichuris suis]KFD70913.1 hypothetical protein M514_01145 [Trichuris suis]